MNRAILLEWCGMEGVYVKNKLVAEGKKPINGKSERVIYFAELGKRFNFDLGELRVGNLSKRGIYLVDKNGGLPDRLDELDGEIFYYRKNR